MRSNPMYFSGKPMLPVGDQCSYQQKDHALPSAVDVVPPWLGMSMPFHGAHLNPSGACPRRFIIFETTNTGNRIVFHPDLSSTLLNPDPAFSTSHNNACHKDFSSEKKTTSLLKENSADIDAILRTEYEETLESDDDVVSTARSCVTNECISSADSFSDHRSISRKKSLRTRDSSESRGHKKKHQKLQKMMNKLKEIVPGAKQMTTANVLDEAIHYLKFLQAEVKKIEDGNSKV